MKKTNQTTPPHYTVLERVGYVEFRRGGIKGREGKASWGRVPMRGGGDAQEAGAQHMRAGLGPPRALHGPQPLPTRPWMDGMPIPFPAPPYSARPLCVPPPRPSLPFLSFPARALRSPLPPSLSLSLHPLCCSFIDENRSTRQLHGTRTVSIACAVDPAMAVGWRDSRCRRWRRHVRLGFCIVTTMGRAPCCEKDSVKRGPWTPEEDTKLLACIAQHGTGSWRTLPKKAGILTQPALKSLIHQQLRGVTGKTTSTTTAGV